MSTSLSADEMREVLRQRVESAGSQIACAKDLGVSAQYINDCLNGRREIGKSIAGPLGYEPLTVYAPSAVKESPLKSRKAGGVNG